MIIMSLIKRVGEGKTVPRNVADAYYEKMKLRWEGIDPDEFARGMNVEMEHFDVTKGDLTQTAKIALAHLKELRDYYTRLDKMEKAGKEKKEGKILRKKYNTLLFDDVDDD